MRAGILQDSVDVIRAAGPDITVPDNEYCSEPEKVDEQLANELATRFRGDEATLAFRLREQGLFASKVEWLETLQAIETALVFFW